MWFGGRPESWWCTFSRVCGSEHGETGRGYKCPGPSMENGWALPLPVCSVWVSLTLDEAHASVFPSLPIQVETPSQTHLQRMFNQLSGPSQENT